MTNIEKVKLGAEIVAGLGIGCLAGVVLGKYISGESGLKKVGCMIGTTMISMWVTNEVNAVVDKNIDNTVLIAQKAIEIQMAKQQKAIEEKNENKEIQEEKNNEGK